MSKNIWILNHYAISPDMAGGTRHYDLGRELIKRGYRITIFASGFSHSSKKYVKVKPKDLFNAEDYDRVRFVWLNTIPYYGNNWRRILNMISYGIRILKVAKKFEKPDVIVGSSVHPFAVIAAWWLAKRYKVKFIFEVRDLWPQTAVEMGVMKADGIQAKLLYIWEKFMYKKAEKIIVLLPYAKEYIKNRGINSEKVVWISNGVDLERFDNPESLKPNSEMAIAFKQYKGKFKVVYAGAHGPVNGLETIIDAAYSLSKKSANIHFFLIGEGIEKKKMIKRTNQYGIDNITFLDPVSKSQIPEILRQSDLLMFCLRDLNIYKYGISLNKIYDYFASGKPVIMTGDPVNNIVQEAGAGITVEPENPEALAEAIIKIQEMSPEERQSLGANGRVYVEKYYSTQVLGDILESIL